MAKTLVKVTLFGPAAPGDTPANGIIEGQPTARRHVEGGTPADYVVLPARFSARLGDALTYTDNSAVTQTAPATPGVAWFWIDATDVGPYAGMWAWKFTERTSNGTTRHVLVPTSPTAVDYGDLPDVDMDTLIEIPDAALPAWTAALNAEILARTNGDAANSAALLSHTSNMSNPHGTTKAQVGLGSADNTSDANKPVSGPQQTALNAKQNTSEKGVANGYASLDGSGQVPVSQLPGSVMTYEGTWNATTNTPTLADGTGNAGMMRKVTVAGTINLGSGAISFAVGDYAIHNGTAWEKADTTDAVASVNGQTGVVALTAANIPTTPSGGVAATDVEGAIDELDAEKEAVANKSTNTALGTSDTAYPSQKAVKTYVDTATAPLTAVAGAPTLVPTGVTEIIPANRQTLFAVASTVDGTLQIDGTAVML